MALCASTLGIVSPDQAARATVLLKAGGDSLPNQRWLRALRKHHSQYRCTYGTSVATPRFLVLNARKLFLDSLPFLFTVGEPERLGVGLQDAQSYLRSNRG